MTQSSVPKPAELTELELADEALRKKLQHHALLMLKRGDLAEDAVQETLKRAWEKRGDYDRNSGDPHGWVFGFLRLVILETDRKMRKKSSQPLTEESGWQEMEATFMAGENQKQLRELLDQLSEQDRNLIVWHHLDHYSHNEISLKIGISPGNSRVMLARAMVKLKDLAKTGGAI